MYRRILVPLDGSPRAEAALGQLLHLLGPDSEVILMRVVGSDSVDLTPSVVAPAAPMTNFAGVVPPRIEQPVESEDGHNEVDHYREGGRRYLDQVIATHAIDSRRRLVVISDSDPARAIADQAASDNVDLILMSTHGRSGVARLLMGSVAEKVLHLARVPVLLVRSE